MRRSCLAIRPPAADYKAGIDYAIEHGWIELHESGTMVTYIDIDLDSIEAYWNGPLLHNVRAFQTEQSPTTLFNAASSVWHLHDWVWHDRNPGTDTWGSKEFKVYRDGLIAACPALGWLQDIADAGKHRGLGRKTRIQAAEPRKEGMFMGLLALTREATRFYLVLNDDTQQDAHFVVMTAVEFWRAVELKDRNLPSPVGG
jgi:hypothetical protein